MGRLRPRERMRAAAIEPADTVEFRIFFMLSFLASA